MRCAIPAANPTNSKPSSGARLIDLYEVWSVGFRVRSKVGGSTRDGTASPHGGFRPLTGQVDIVFSELAKQPNERPSHLACSLSPVSKGAAASRLQPPTCILHRTHHSTASLREICSELLLFFFYVPFCLPRLFHRSHLISTRSRQSLRITLSSSGDGALVMRARRSSSAAVCEQPTNLNLRSISTGYRVEVSAGFTRGEHDAGASENLRPR